MFRLRNLTISLHGGSFVVTNEVISALRGQISAAKENGLSMVSLDSLSNLIDAIEQQAKQTPEGVEQSQALVEKFKAELVALQSSDQQAHETSLEMLRATVDTSHLAIKSALLINGGAAVAFLAFLGTAWSRFSSASVKATLAGSLEHFIEGVMWIGIGSGIAYLCQAAFSGQFGKHGQIIGEVLRWISVALVLGSFAKFYFGCQMAIEAFVMDG